MEPFGNRIDLSVLPDSLHSDLSVIELKTRLDYTGLEVYYTTGCWVVDICHGRYLQADFLKTFDLELCSVNGVQAKLSHLLDSRAQIRPSLLDFLDESLMDSWRNQLSREICFLEELPSGPSYAVVVYAVVLLALVYQYLTGNVDRGGSKAYSRSSLDFRDIYIATLLFLGAYVWIKFREVAFKGVYSRKLTDQGGRITRVVYEPRFKPPRENGRVFGRIYLGQYSTPEEASILNQIAAFYYNKNQDISLDLGDGRWFPIPPMNEGERSLTGVEKRAWVKVQVMKVYEEFKKEKAEAALVQELLKACEDEVPQEQDEGVAVSNGHSLGSQEGPAIPVTHLTPNTQSGMAISGSNQLDLLQIVHNQQELISYQQQQILLKDQQISLKDQQLQDCWAQISEFKQQHYFQQLLQDINEGVPSNEVEMEQSLHLQNHQSLTILPYAGAEAQEGFI